MKLSNGIENSIEICSFASGSSGNCYLVKSKTTALLIDSGISAKKILDRIEALEMKKEDIGAILITHGHDDHIKSLHTLAKKIPAFRVYTTKETFESFEKFQDEERTVIIDGIEEFSIGDIKVKPFLTSHDTEGSVGFSFYKDEKQISIVTDTGCVSEEIFHEIKNADVLVIEANHEVEMLKMGRYPYYLKQRILGKQGHLSNEACARCVTEIIKYHCKPRKILLAHLSKENNTKYHAKLTMKNCLEEAGFSIGNDIYVEVLMRDERSSLY